MPKTFAAPKSRTPRSAETDAAKLEAKKQFKLLSGADETSDAQPSNIVEVEEIRRSGEVQTVHETTHRDSHHVKPLAASSDLLDTVTSEDLISPLQAVSFDVPPDTTEEEELSTPVSVSDSQSLSKSAPAKFLDSAPPYSPANMLPGYMYSSRRDNVRPSSNRKQISIYPSDEAVFRLEMIRVREKIGSAMIIEHALSEYLATHTDEEIVAFMRSQGHRLRRAR